MKAWRCSVCGKAVTEKDLKQGIGGVVEKKVYCSDHLPASASAIGKRRRASDRKNRTGRVSRTSARRAERSEESAAFDEDFEEEGSKKAPVAVLSVMAVIILGLLGVIFFLVKGNGDTSTGKTPQKEPAKAEKAPMIDKLSTEKNKKEKHTAPAKEPEKKAADKEEARMKKLDKGFKELITEAEKEFDGTIEGFHRGARVVRIGVIENNTFKETEYIEQAKQFIEEKRSEVNSRIEKEFIQASNTAFELMDQLEQKKALKTVAQFPEKYRSFGDWNKKCETLEKDLKKSARDQYEKWIASAKETLKDGHRASAVRELTEIYEAAGDIILDELAGKLKRQISVVKAGGGIAKEGKAASSVHTLLEKANRAYHFGEVRVAEKIYNQLLKGFASDEVFMKERSKVQRRLSEIQSYKQKGADEPIRVLFYSNFESVYSLGKHGKLWKTGLRQQVNTFGDSGYALKCSPKKGAKHHGVAAKAGVPSDRSVWENEENAYMAFRFYMEGDQRSNKADRLYIQCMNRTQNDNFHYSFPYPAFGEWSYLCVPLVKWEDNEHVGKIPKKGDEFSSISIGYGKPGDSVIMYIDDVMVVSGSSLYYMKEKLANKMEMIQDITSDPQKDFYKLDIEILDNLIAKADPSNNSNTILAVGGLHASSRFLKTLRNEKGLSIRKVRGSGTPKITSDDIVPQAVKMIGDEKPGIVVIIMGINDIINEKITKENKGEMKEKYQTLVDESFKAGAIPVICNLPYCFEKEKNSTVTDLNIIMNNVAKMNYVPIINSYMLFSVNSSPSRFYKSPIVLGYKGYKAIDEKMMKLYSVFDKYIFK